MIGTDGMQLLIAVWAETAPDWLAHVPIVEILRQTWVHQYYVENDQVRLRAASDLAPSGSRFDSPYDIDARFGNKRSVTKITFLHVLQGKIWILHRVIHGIRRK